jgi:lipoprotein-anchoring transpeptidase ErfK/SrfK
MFQLVLQAPPERVVRRDVKMQSLVMARILVSPGVACSVAAGAAVALIASATGAASQVLDPGWQLVYAGQPGDTEGLVESMFGDGTGQAIYARAYQPPAPIYSEAEPGVEPSVQERAPVAQQSSSPAPAVVAAQRARNRRQVPAYYQLVPAPQTGAAAQPTYYYRQAPAQFQAAPSAPTAGWRAVAPAPTQVDPRYIASPSAGQLRGSQAASTGYRLVAAPAAQSDPQFTGTVAVQPAHGPQAAPATYRAAAQPVQQGPQSGGSAGSQQIRGLFATSYQGAAGSYLQPQYQQQPPRQQLAFGYQAQPQQQGYFYQHGAYQPPAYAPSTAGDMTQQQLDPRYQRQVIEYHFNEKPGTIIVDTPHFFLYLVLDGGRAIRYGIGVGRPGFTWAGVKSVSAMREWPDWRPPDEMLARRPDLPHYMRGGPDNPLGARALYLGSSLYRIHGSNEPWSIGTQVSSGCIRLRNEDIIDLYGRVKVGAKVIVI